MAPPSGVPTAAPIGMNTEIHPPQERHTAPHGDPPRPKSPWMARSGVLTRRFGPARMVRGEERCVLALVCPDRSAACSDARESPLLLASFFGCSRDAVFLGIGRAEASSRVWFLAVTRARRDPVSDRGRDQ
jgi:hypothetical protein